MSQKETAGPIADLEVSESPNGNLSKLVGLARRAYEQKQTKDCLDLTRAILLIDPDNAQAQSMRSSMQSEMHRDLENARAFLRQAHSKENPEKQSQVSRTAVPANLELHSDGGDHEPLVRETVPLPIPGDSPRIPKIRWFVRASVPIVLVLGAMVASLPRLRTKPNPVEASLLSLSASDSSKQIANMNADEPDLLLTRSATAAVASTPAPTPPVTEQPLTTDRSPAIVATPAPGARAPQPVMASAGGTLAVSSPTSIDIYKDDAYLGSAPVSLELPPGAHTLEYRHGSLRRYVTHVINSNETTKAMIIFDVSVQINSKPWAEVFLDGVEKTALGQTPLSGVRVPIGSVLIFENPQFQTKKYRVTGNEAGIQIVFP